MEWLERYLYIDIRDIFFSEFSIVLHEWLSKLTTEEKFFQAREPTEWSTQFIQWLKRDSDPINRVVNFWVDSILEVYITQIAVDMIKSYSEMEREFF